MNVTGYHEYAAHAGRTLSLFITAALLGHVLAGCGGGGGGSSAGSSTPAPYSAPAAKNSFTVTEDSYGLQSATYLTAEQGSGTIVLRAAIATSLTDPSFKTVMRIDIPSPSVIEPGTYALGTAGAGSRAFPGGVLIFNGHPSTMLQAASGTITFTSFGTNNGDLIAGNMVLVFVDRNSPLLPTPTYTCKANFAYYVNSYGPTTPSPQQVNGASLYAGNCGGCHSLGSYDQSGTPDLALRGGELNGLFSADMPGHKNITLSAHEIWALRVFLNAN
jgi:hypothetical protein